MKITRQKLATVLAMLLTLVVLGSLLILYRPMYPISNGTSDEFWNVATGVDLRIPPTDGMGGVVLIEGDYAYYAPASMDSTWTYRVPLAEVMKDFPRVIAVLEKRAGDPTDKSAITTGYRRWKKLSPSFQGGPTGLERCINDAISNRLFVDHSTLDFAGWSNEMRAEIRRQVTAAHYYWANFTMEFLFLSGLVWFVLWPAVRDLSLGRWLLHWGLAPFIFLLPSWFGYCAVCAGGVGPAGGIVYPYLLCCLRFDRGTNAAWELDFFRALPKLFEPMNQTAWQLNDVLDPKFPLTMHIAGPIDAAIASGVLCFAILVYWFAARYIRLSRARRPGFEIIPNSLAPSQPQILSPTVVTGTVTPPPTL